MSEETPEKRPESKIVKGHKTSVPLDALPDHMQEKMKRRAQGGASQSVFDNFFSPFRTRPSIEAPTKRKDLNEWYRFYFKHDPLVGTALELHSEFPLSRFRLEHDDPVVRDFFNEQVEDLGLFEFMVMMGLEYHVVGECFPFGFFDDPADPTRWTRFILLDPDRIKINAHKFAEPYDKKGYSISLEPDSDLQTIVQRGPHDPATGQLYQSMPPDIIAAVKARKDIPLDSLQVSHFKRTQNYFNVRGESAISRVVQDLMYQDKLRDAQYCHPPATEVLTERGFLPIAEVQKWDKVATFDENTEEIEFHCPIACMQFDYEGPMYRFQTRKVDFECTPDHKMLVQGTSTNRDWKVMPAKDVKHTYRVRTNGEWIGETPPEYVEVVGKKWPVEIFLEFAGYYIAEGSASKSRVKLSRYTTALSQKPETANYEKVSTCCAKAPMKMGAYKCGRFQVTEGKQNRNYFEFFKEQFGANSFKKQIPSWIKRLSPDALEILLDALVLGDGHDRMDRKDGTPYVTYASVSKRLIDDVMEIAWKCGYHPRLGCEEYYESGSRIYKVYWSTDKSKGEFPLLRRKSDGPKSIETYPYKGKVYCLEVPNNFFVTRLRGKLAIHHNSIADRHVTPREFYFIGEPEAPADQAEIDNFQNLLAQQYNMPNQSIVTHHAVKVQWEGASGRILPLQPEFDNIEKRVLAGLGISKAFVTGEGPSHSYASVALDVMIARYMLYRTRMEDWLVNQVFRPLCRIHGIYKPKQSEVSHRFRVKRKHRIPDLPRIKWEKAELRDENVKTMLFERLVGGGMIPRRALYELLNMSPEQVRQELKAQSRQDQEDRAEGVMVGMGPGGMAGGGGGLPGMGGLGNPMGGMGRPPGGVGLPAGTLPPLGAVPPGSPGGTPAGGITSPMGGGPMQVPPASRRPM